MFAGIWVRKGSRHANVGGAAVNITLRFRTRVTVNAYMAEKVIATERLTAPKAARQNWQAASEYSRKGSQAYNRRRHQASRVTRRTDHPGSGDRHTTEVVQRWHQMLGGRQGARPQVAHRWCTAGRWAAAARSPQVSARAVNEPLMDLMTYSL